MGKAILTIGAVILNDNQEVLLVRHTEAAGSPTGTYGLPAGRVENGEDIPDACIREIQEESGLVVKRENLVRLPSVYFAEIERKDGKNIFVLIPFLVLKYTGNIQSCEENEPIWINIQEISSYTLLPNVEEIVREALEF